MAERVGFEPTVAFPLHSLSRRALSTAQTPLRGWSLLSLTKAHYPNNLGYRACPHEARQFSVHFERDVHIFAFAFNLQNSGSAGWHGFQRCAQGRDRFNVFSVKRVDYVTGLQVRFQA
jgi:hypothetical protein